MDLPVMPPVAPMLSKSVPDIPDVGHVEPKWDGFRTIVFRDGDEVLLGSRNERPMTRYFPEVVEAVLANTPQRCVLDGEIVVARGDRLDFEALQLRVHPAASRVALLSRETPASLVAFDVLALDDEDLMGRPFRERRERLLETLARAEAPVHVTRATADMEQAREWFEAFEGAGLDGVVAKPLDGTYQPDKRTMFKVKHDRTADCVVAGFRWHKSGPVVGSLLLGCTGTTDRCSTSEWRPRSRWRGASPCSTSSSPTGCRTAPRRRPGTPGAAGRTRRPTRTGGCPATSPGGTPARTSRSSRCGPSSWSKSRTTRWRATGSGTRRSSGAGAPTGRRSRAPTTSWIVRCGTTLPAC